MMKNMGMVLEGGGMRGIYTAGVLDVFMENGVSVDGVMGVSAGALYGCSYVSGQIGRSIRYSLKYGRDPRYMSLRSLVETGDLFGVDFCYREIPEHLDPFDNDTFEASGTEFYVVCTDAVTGKAVYRKCSSLRGNQINWARASASLPLVSRVVEIDGMKLLDGGLADSIPVRAMRRQGYRRNIVVLTQPEGYMKKPSKMMPVMHRVLRNYPKVVEIMKCRHQMYNREVRETEALAARGEVLVIRPSRLIKIKRTETNPDKIREMYELGRADAVKALPSVYQFIMDSRR